MRPKKTHVNGSNKAVGFTYTKKEKRKKKIILKYWCGKWSATWMLY